jgi:hypothetical protein
MKPMNDQRFFELAMKTIARQASDAERAELDALLAGNPALGAEFERMRLEAALAKEALPLVEASAATGGKLPEYARGRLQTKVRESLGRPAGKTRQPDRSLAWGWRWWLGLAATATAVIVGLSVFFAPSRPGVVQLAVLDLAGTSRGAGDADETLLRMTWRGAEVNHFESAELLAGWLKAWPTNLNATAVKVIYDRSAGEVRVSGQRAGRKFAKDFPVNGTLQEALQGASAYVQEEAGR